MHGIDALCLHLRAEGLTLGVPARLHVEAIVAAVGVDDRAALRDLLAAVVVKGRDEIAAFDRAFARWAPVEQHARAGSPPPRPVEPTAPPPRRRRRRALGLALLAGALLVGLWLAVTRPTEQAPPPPDDPIEAPAPAEAPEVDGPAYAETFLAPTIVITPGEPTAPDRWWDLALLALALALTAFSIWRATREPHPLPLSTALRPEDPAPRPLEALAEARPPDRLLGRAGREAMVWGIDHFVGEQPSRHLDLRATVDATLRAGGLPTLVHTRERHVREVWLWVDDLATRAHPEIERLVTEITRALAAARLPYEVARFDGVPAVLTTAEGERFSPAEIDARRDVARVAVLTDGRWLTARARRRAGRRPGELVRLLRTLAHWPAVAFADFARGEHGLDALLAEHGIAREPPEAVAEWLGGQVRRVAYDATDVRLWAGGCALCPEAVDRETALQLRDALAAAGLRADAWALPALADDAGQRGVLRWRDDVARARIARLLRVEGSAGGIFAAARAFWRDRWAPLADEAAAEVDREHRRAHRALIALWSPDPADIDAAAEALVALRGRLQPVLDERLRHMCPRVDGSIPSDVFALPWEWYAQAPLTRRRLRAAGLAAEVGALRKEELRPAGRFWASAGLGGVLFIVALIALVITDAEPPTGPPACDGFAICRPTPADDGWRVLVGDPRSAAIERAGAGARLTVGPTGDAPCRVDDGDVTLVRCGQTRDAPTRPMAGWPARSVALIGRPVSDADTFARVAQLIDHGALDLALFAADAQDPVAAARPALRTLALGEGDQLLVVTEAPPSAEAPWPVDAVAWLPIDALPSATATFGEAPRPMSEAYPAARALVGAPVTLAPRGEAWCPRREQTLDGMTYVWVCGGRFEMGSADGEPDERPVHAVTITGFWMGKHEVTNAQYRAAGHADHQPDEAGDRPVTRVSWDEARAYCASIGGRLPTEAEWEYAARGRDGRVYPWGDEPPSDERAVFGESLGDPKPIGGRPAGAGPFGTHDQAGNVWEWVADCYDADGYRQHVDTDPVVDTAACERRVLRGGSFVGEPRVLRAAYRFGDGPGDRNRDLGFRCARVSRPEQPVGP